MAEFAEILSHKEAYQIKIPSDEKILEKILNSYKNYRKLLIKDLDQMHTKNSMTGSLRIKSSNFNLPGMIKRITQKEMEKSLTTFPIVGNLGR